MSIFAQFGFDEKGVQIVSYYYCGACGEHVPAKHCYEPINKKI